MSFKSLNLNRDLIPGLLANFRSGATVEGPVAKTPTQFEYVVCFEGSKAMIHFYYNKDGTTTIQPKVGKCQQLSEEIASHVKRHGLIDERKNISLQFRHVDSGNFLLLLEYLFEELKCGCDEDKVENGYRLVKVRGRCNDTLIVKYYDNGTLQIQGKPLHLYLETTVFLSEFLDLGDIIAAQSTLYQVSIDPTDIEDELQALLPRSYGYLDPVHLKILSSSLVLQKLKLPLSDYTPFAFPALKVLEGYTKKLLEGKGIFVTRDGFGGFFSPSATGSTFILTDEYRERIGCRATCDAIQRAYSYLHRHRNTLFHAGASSVSTRIIERRTEAEEIIMTVVSIIDESYAQI